MDDRRFKKRTLLLIAYLLFAVLPVYWMVNMSFKTNEEITASFSLWPHHFTWDNYKTIFTDESWYSGYVNSLIYVGMNMVMSLLVALPAAYAFSRYKFPGRRFLLISLFAVNAFPKIGLYISMAGVFYSLNLISTFAGVVIVQLIGTIVFMTWIPAAAFSAIPRSLEEAARDVGAGPLRVFFRVTFPLAAPAIFVAMILSFLASFDEAQGTFLVGVPKYITMPTEMYTLVLNYPEQVAAVFSILLAIPSVVLMSLARKHVMGGRLAEGFQIR